MEKWHQATMRREALAVVDAIYACIRSHDRSEVIRLPTMVKNEFKALLFRKMLDGRLGSKWGKEDEKRFQTLFVIKGGPKNGLSLMKILNTD